MSSSDELSFGDRLYAMLPAVYRARDEDGQLHAYLDGFGCVLDGLYELLQTRLEDCFVDSCQDWLLPYFAQLLDVSLLSPDVKGQRLEVERALAWRKAKGTLGVAREITQVVSGLQPVALRESWSRVLRTVRVGVAPGSTGLTASTREPQRQAKPWDDTSWRTVDQRTPDWHRGHMHPKRLLVYVPVPTGFPHDPCGNLALTVDWPAVQALASEVLKSEALKSEVFASTGEVTDAERAHAKALLDVSVSPDGCCVRIAPLEDVKGRVQIRAVVDGGTSGQISGLLDGKTYIFERLNLLANVSAPIGARVRLEKVAARGVVVQTTGARSGLDGHASLSPAGHATGGVALAATDSLLQSFEVPRGLVRLDACTVMSDSVAESLNASDCLLLGRVRRDLNQDAAGPAGGCIRYSRIAPDQPPTGWTEVSGTCCTHQPVFYSQFAGKHGWGVLHPATPRSISQGAEDGGEMGAFHHLHHAWAWDATERKLAEHMPLGMVAVLVPTTETE